MQFHTESRIGRGKKKLYEIIIQYFNNDKKKLILYIACASRIFFFVSPSRLVFLRQQCRRTDLLHDRIIKHQIKFLIFFSLPCSGMISYFIILLILLYRHSFFFSFFLFCPTSPLPGTRICTKTLSCARTIQQWETDLGAQKGRRRWTRGAGKSGIPSHSGNAEGPSPPSSAAPKNVTSYNIIHIRHTRWARRRRLQHRHIRTPIRLEYNV